MIDGAAKRRRSITADWAAQVRLSELRLGARRPPWPSPGPASGTGSGTPPATQRSR